MNEFTSLFEAKTDGLLITGGGFVKDGAGSDLRNSGGGGNDVTGAGGKACGDSGGSISGFSGALVTAGSFGLVEFTISFGSYFVWT